MSGFDETEKRTRHTGCSCVDDRTNITRENRTSRKVTRSTNRRSIDPRAWQWRFDYEQPWSSSPILDGTWTRSRKRKPSENELRSSPFARYRFDFHVYGLIDNFIQSHEELDKGKKKNSGLETENEARAINERCSAKFVLLLDEAHGFVSPRISSAGFHRGMLQRLLVEFHGIRTELA